MLHSSIVTGPRWSWPIDIPPGPTLGAVPGMPPGASAERLVLGDADRFTDLVEEGLELRQFVSVHPEAGAPDRDHASPLAVGLLDLRFLQLRHVVAGDFTAGGSEDLDDPAVELEYHGAQDDLIHGASMPAQRMRASMSTLMMTPVVPRVISRGSDLCRPKVSQQVSSPRMSSQVPDATPVGCAVR